MNKKIIGGLAVLVLLGFASCQFMKSQPTEEIPVPVPLTPLPQDPFLEVYFNHSQVSSYSEPYRQVTRPGDDLEQLLVYNINSARKTVDVAVQELRLPRIAQALVHRHRSGIKVRVIVENLYNRPIALSPSQLAALPKESAIAMPNCFSLPMPIKMARSLMQKLLAVTHWQLSRMREFPLLTIRQTVARAVA
jgi:hypothetical protein